MNINNYNYTSRARKVLVIIIAIILAASAVILNFINRNGNQVLLWGVASLSGIITAAQSLLAIAMVVIDFGLGSILSSIFLGISMFINIIVIFVVHNYSTIPGLCYYIATYTAIHIIKSGIRKERKNACIDELTGISNRRHIISHIDRCIYQKKSFYCIYLDLNHFKYVNDTEGHEKGDQVLKTITSLWKNIDPDNAAIGRIDGDEFIVTVPIEACTDIMEYTQKYIDAVEDYLNPNGWSSLYVNVVCGISSYPEDGKTASDIIRKADIAMYMAKNAGRSGLCRYESSFEDEMHRDQYIESRIRTALDKDQFFMVYQPQFETETGKLRGFESLIRMKSGNDAPLSPSEFIPVAEKSEYIIEIGEFVINNAMRDFSPIVAANPSITLSINVSAKQLLSKDFANVVMKALDDTSFNSHNLELEITEYCLLDSTQEAINVINTLKDMGIMLAMDDFGTGYSSFSYLTKLPIDLIKIDKSIIDTMGNGEIVGAIASMGHSLGCKIIAEGVEYEGQLDILSEKRVDYIQGFVWGRPVSLDAVEELI